MSLAGRTAAAVGWTAGAKVAQQVLQFGLTILLMRLLGPESFGLIGMVLVFTGFAAVFSEMGFGSALVQRQEVTEAHRSTVFWLTLATGAALSLLLLLAAPLVARFYGEPLLEPLTALVAVTFVFGAPGAVPRALLQKRMRFDRLAVVQVAALVVSGGIALGMALAGAGVWSLAVQGVVAALVSSTLHLGLAGWGPRTGPSRAALRDLYRYGAGLTGFNVVNYWARSADNLLVGRFMGSAALGLYSRAYSLMLMPLRQIIGVLAPAMFPTLASIQGDTDRVRRIYLRTMQVITLVTFPLMFGLVAVADPFVRGLLGPEWLGVIPLTQILAFVGMIQSVCNPTGWIYTSQGRTDWLFWWGVGAGGLLVGAIVIGVALGTVESVAWAYLVGNVLIAGPCLSIPGRLIGMKARDVAQAVSGNLACAAVMALAVWGIRLALPDDLAPLLQLAILVPAGVLVYGALAWLCHLPAVEDLADLLRRARPGLYARVAAARAGLRRVT